MIYRDFLEAGHVVFPLYGVDAKGNCGCGDPDCEAPFKHPRFPNWSNFPLLDEETISGLEELDWFATGYGVLAKGFLVIDVDARNGGVESFAKFSEKYPSVNECGFEVVTGSGGGSKHVYFSLPEPLAMVQTLPEYPGLDFKTTGYLVGPGSLHKSGGRYQEDGYVSDITPAPLDIIEALRRPEYHRSEYDGRIIEVSHSDIADMLRHIPNFEQEYDFWVNIGMAIHHTTQGTGFQLWDDWSQTSTKYNPRSMENKWHSFGRSSRPSTVGTLRLLAQNGGWIEPVTFVVADDFIEEPAPEYNDGLPFSIDGCILTKPPGFAGEVAEWIESQSRRPRRHLAVAASLMAIGNIAGLRFMDEKDGATTNMFAFCVAGSRTGKESIQQAVMALHKAAGIIAASHGAIKSEQEVTRNLTRHQAAFYIIDEIGIFLQKVSNGKKKGGTPYLDGVIGIIMSIYSKANGQYLITGDAKEDVRNFTLKELAQVKKMMGEGETPFLLAKEASLESILGFIETGLSRPFISLIGFTTPVTFDDLVDFESATNGFIGRALIFNERDTTPATKPNFRAPPLPPHIESAVQQIFHGGDFDICAGGRVENYSERTLIPTDEKAVEMLINAEAWMQEQALEAKVKNGLEALWMGAYELVTKVSLILSIRDGLRTSEHVRWAFALVKRDVEEKIRLVVGNDRQKDAPKDALTAKILNLLSGEEPESMGVIVNRLRSFRKEDISTRLSEMVTAGLLIESVSEHPRQKKEIRKYLAAQG